MDLTISAEDLRKKHEQPITDVFEDVFQSIMLEILRADRSGETFVEIDGYGFGIADLHPSLRHIMGRLYDLGYTVTHQEEGHPFLPPRILTISW